MRLATSISLGFALVLAASSAEAEDPSISVELAVEPAKLGPGESARLSVDITVPEGWHLWSLEPGEGPQPLRISIDSPSVELTGAWHGPAPKVVFDRGFQRELTQYEPGRLRLERALSIGPEASAGPLSVPVLVRGQICTEETCLSQRVEKTLALELAATPTGAMAPSFTAGALDAEPIATASAATPLDQGLWKFILIAFLAGLGALATPCVFPAIPLTVSFFSKFSEEDFGRGARLAAFYAVSMMLGFTFFGVLVSILFGVSGIQRFAAHPWFNFALASVLVFFSLNLLGMFEIKTPAFLLGLTNRLEGKYGPASQMTGRSEKGGLRDYLAVGVAAMTATTVFFTCTVAFVGVVLVAASKGDWSWPTLGMLSFSAAFVLPFFLLAMFPQAAKRLRGKHGSWLTVTRVTLGFIELAASSKFFSNADLVWRTNLLSRDVVLTFWIALFGLCAMFLLGWLHLKEGPDAPPPEPDAAITVPRMLFGASIVAFTLYLAVGLFSARPVGGWVDGWLPPPVLPGEEGSGAVAGSGANDARQFAWIHDLEEGRRHAKERSQLVFVNYTGYTCTNCRYMESSVFPLPGIATKLQSMSLVELYTDGIGEVYDRAREDQLARFGTAALPLYAVETAEGKIISSFPSSTNDPSEFESWLAESIATAGASVRATEAASELSLAATSLVDGHPEPAIQKGRWTLLNFWATWCSPCRKELDAFMARLGRELEAQGGRFVTVALEDDDSVADALSFLRQLEVPDASALRLPAELPEGAVDPRLGFSGSVPHTVLVSPEGKVVWKHSEALEESTLRAVLTEHLGFARAAPKSRE